MISAYKPKLDVVIIATIRPEILRLTLDSFMAGLLYGYHTRAIINIDPIGENGHTQREILDLCCSYFHSVVSRTPETPSFSDAVRWCWSQVETEFFLHLEDDWCLKRKVGPEAVLRGFDKPDVVAVRFNLTRNTKFPSDGCLVRSSSLSLNPSIFRSKYVRELLSRFDTRLDPEKQFSSNPSSTSFPNPIFNYFGTPNDDGIVIDTGKKWRNSAALFKWDKSSSEVVWQRSNINLLKRMMLYAKYRLYLAYWRARYCVGSSKFLHGIERIDTGNE